MEEASGPIAYLTISYGKADEVAEYAAVLARAHGLVCFDPQGESCGRELLSLLLRDGSGTVIATR
ncbi:hypothetical protein [Streptomyces flaveolus]|uniref:hypothetical protein n=1 Tax=Streptomyces flaveolus TaxID=67297 RepID=UPI0037F21499